METGKRGHITAAKKHLWLMEYAQHLRLGKLIQTPMELDAFCLMFSHPQPCEWEGVWADLYAEETAKLLFPLTQHHCSRTWMV